MWLYSYIYEETSSTNSSDITTNNPLLNSLCCLYGLWPSLNKWLNVVGIRNIHHSWIWGSVPYLTWRTLSGRTTCDGISVPSDTNHYGTHSNSPHQRWTPVHTRWARGSKATTKRDPRKDYEMKQALLALLFCTPLMGVVTMVIITVKEYTQMMKHLEDERLHHTHSWLVAWCPLG